MFKAEEIGSDSNVMKVKKKKKKFGVFLSDFHCRPGVPLGRVYGDLALSVVLCRHVWLYCICRLLELTPHSSDLLGVSFSKLKFSSDLA